MKFKEFQKAGHWPTLLAAFLYFDISFMAWSSLGPLITYIGVGMDLTTQNKFILTSIPLLSGAALRLPMGALADSYGAKATGLIAQIIMIVGLALVYVFGLPDVAAIAAFGLLLGLGGASFSVALPQASRWYPPQYQGLVMGIAGAGNVGVVLDNLCGPGIAQGWGWRAVYGVLLVLMVFVLVYYWLAAKDAPVPRRRIPWSEYGRILLDPDSRWFMFFYFITFGGFVGLANSLSTYFQTQFYVTPVAGGLMTAIIVALGSCFRPVGGAIADRFGGIKTLSVLFTIVALAYLMIAFMPMGPKPIDGAAGWSFSNLPAVAWGAVSLFSVGVLCLGMGNGAVFQLLPQRFRNEVGVVTGLVGAAGGLGGFMLMFALSYSWGWTHGFGAGFMLFSLLAALGVMGLYLIKTRWRTTWGAVSGARI